MSEATRWCSKCQRHLPPTEFYRPIRRKDKPGSVAWKACRSCSSAYALSRYRDRKDKVNELKIAAGCLDCGYTAHAEALEYDHRPGEIKTANVSEMARRVGRYSWDDILAEIAKCDLVCANCHRVRTTSRGYEKTLRGWDLRKLGIVVTEPTGLPEQLLFDDIA